MGSMESVCVCVCISSEKAINEDKHWWQPKAETHAKKIRIISQIGALECVLNSFLSVGSYVTVENVWAREELFALNILPVSVRYYPIRN